MNNKFIAILATVALLSTSLPAMASFYAGGGIGYFRINSQDFLDEDDELKDDRTAWKAFAGYNINDVFGIEISHIEFGDSGNGPLSLDASGRTLAATLGFPVGERSRLYMKAGTLFWDARASVENVISVSDDDNDTFYGVGMRIGGEEGLGLKVEYEKYSLGNTDVDMPSVSLNVAF